MGGMLLASALNRSISSGINGHFLIFPGGGYAHSIFAAGAMFLKEGITLRRIAFHTELLFIQDCKTHDFYENFPCYFLINTTVMGVL